MLPKMGSFTSFPLSRRVRFAPRAERLLGRPAAGGLALLTPVKLRRAMILIPQRRRDGLARDVAARTVERSRTGAVRGARSEAIAARNRSTGPSLGLAERPSRCCDHPARRCESVPRSAQ